VQSPGEPTVGVRRRQRAVIVSFAWRLRIKVPSGPVRSDLTNSELSAGIISEGGEVTLSLLMFQCLISHSKTKINLVTLLKFLPHLQIDV